MERLPATLSPCFPSPGLHEEPSHIRGGEGRFTPHPDPSLLLSLSSLPVSLFLASRVPSPNSQQASQE